MRTSDGSEIVFHPEVPGEVIARLRDAREGLVPFGGEPPAKRARHAVWPSLLWGGVAASLTAAAVFVSVAARQYDSGNPDNAGYGRLDGLADLAIYGSIVAWIVFTATIITAGRRLRERRFAADAGYYHRRYVVPETDLDRKAVSLWSRVGRAAGRIRSSEVVEQQRIDSVRLSKVLPYRIWDIAETMARLSSLREEHHEILAGVDVCDPDIEVVLGPQCHARALAEADIERQIRQLEEFADRAEEADAAGRREQAMSRLAALNDPHADLLTRIGSSGEDAEIAALMSHDVQAVIEQANEAVRRANEAGRSPGLLGNG
jgi:hypothetical protein